MAVLSQTQIVRAFGNPFRYVRTDGTISPRWEERIIAYARLPAPLPLSWNRKQQVTRFKCHRLLVSHFTRVMAMAHADPTVWATIGDFGGVYNWRTQRTSTAHLSTHCWAIAIDIDVRDNVQGNMPRVHPRLIDMFESCGFLWGGTFAGRARDGMHWQFNDLAML